MHRLSALALLLLASCASRPPAGDATTGPARDVAHADTVAISALARDLSSDAMRGRGPFTPENERAARLLATRLEQLGARPVVGNRMLVPFTLRSRPADTVYNVLGVLPARDGTTTGELIGITAHLDHLGVGTPDASGDSIYNGFLDAALPVAMVMDVATRRARLPGSRPLLVAFFNLEEQGLLGSNALLARPDAPALVDRLTLLIGVDAGSPAGEAVEWQVMGALPAHPAARLADSLAVTRGWTTTSTAARPIADVFPFAQRGVPVLFPIPGTTWRGYTGAARADAMRRFDHYHQPSDAWRADFPMTGTAHFADWLWDIAQRASEQPPAPVRVEQESHTTALLIAVSAVSDSVAWVSGAGGTWLRTLDGGTTWQGGRVPGADALQFRDVHALDANRAWLLSIGNGAQSRIYQTSDGGAHWALQFQNADSSAFFDCMDFWDARRGIVVGDEVRGRTTLLTTEDGGAHWTRRADAAAPTAPRGEGSFAASGTCLVTHAGGAVWIVAADSVQTRVLRSRDFGATWSSHALPFTVRAGTGAQSVSFRDATNGMAFGGGSTAKPGDQNVAFSRDGGATWSLRAPLPLASGAWGGVYVPRSTPAIVVAVGPSGAVLSRDEGLSWTVIDRANYWSAGFASPRAGWAVGAKGRITKLGGF